MKANVNFELVIELLLLTNKGELISMINCNRR